MIILSLLIARAQIPMIYINCVLQALDNVNNIEQRLKGVITRNKSENIPLCLSIEGQTNHLILEATNVDNLCQMWYGWGSYL